MGLSYRTYLESKLSVYGCLKCKTHLSTSESIISKVKKKKGQRDNCYMILIPV